MSPRVLRRSVAPALAAAVLLRASLAHATDPDRVEWSRDWPRVRLVEVLDIVAVTAASIEIDSQVAPSKTPRWHGGIAFDDDVRNALKGRSYRAQASASDLSDDLYKATVFAPYVVDVFFVTLSVHENADVALQMGLIDMQSLGVTGLLALTAERTVGRARPYAADCGPDHVVRDAAGRPLLNVCDGGETESFFSGHAAATATMAGLTCVHHQHLPLYGGGVADLAPCVVMIGASLTTGVARVVADRHWASDVIVGWGIGALSGYVLPSLLHYGFSSGRPVGEISFSTVHAVPVPQAYADGAGFAFVGRF